MSSVLLAILWSLLMAGATWLAALPALRKRPSGQMERLAAFAVVDGVALGFVVVAMAACFVFATELGLEAGAIVPFVIVLGSYAAVSTVLLFALVVNPLRRAAARALRDDETRGG